MLKTIITEFLKIAGHKAATEEAARLCALIDLEIKNATDGFEGGENIDPFYRVRPYLPIPFDAVNTNVIRYLNSAIVTIAYNYYEKKYGSIKEAWKPTREAFKKDVIDMYSIISDSKKIELNTVISPEEIIIQSVWNG